MTSTPTASRSRRVSRAHRTLPAGAALRAAVWCVPALVATAGFASAQEFRKFAAAAQEPFAAKAGASILRDGGNAIDAATATAFALAVTHPAAGNIGGGGFIVAFDPASKRVRTFDFRETAPASADERMYLDADGRPRAHHRSGDAAAGVPGTVRGLALAHQAMGKLPWPRLLEPAVALAHDGFPIPATLAASLNSQLQPARRRPASASKSNLGKHRAGGVSTPAGPYDDDSDRLADFPAAVKAFAKPDGTPWRAGDRLIQPDLAAALQRIARDGPDDFYEGVTARLIVASMQANHGSITADDLKRYRAVERPPVTTLFRGHEIYGMGPPSSGGVTIALMLNILSRYDLKADGPTSPVTLHRVTEAMRRAYCVRALELGDPDFNQIPVAKLVSMPFADGQAANIGDRATPSASLASLRIEPAESSETTHFSVVDASGGAVSMTYTLEQGYGSKQVVAGAGFLLNNEMGDFNLVPGRTDASGQIGTKPNRIEPLKRPLSSMSPTIVLKNGKVRAVTGSPGGRTIPNTTLWVLLNLLEFNLDARTAVAAPRSHHAWFPDVLVVERDWPGTTLDALRSRGHAVRVEAVQGDAHSVVVDAVRGVLVGAPDPRRKTAQAAGD